MKKYLFDRIIIADKRVYFYYANEENVNNKLKIITEQKYKTPKNFKEFLKCLERTTIQEDMNYSITEILGKKVLDTNFDCLLNFVVEDVFKTHNPSTREIISFYKVANKIKENAVKEKQIINKIPKEYIK